MVIMNRNMLKIITLGEEKYYRLNIIIQESM